MCKLAWIDEEEEDIFDPMGLTLPRHDIDPYLCAVEALDALVLGFSKWNLQRNDTSAGASTSTDFSELIVQKTDASLGNEAAGGKPGVAAASKKKSDASKPAVVGEGVACSILEKSTDILQLVPFCSDNLPSVSKALLQLLVNMMKLPGGIKAMLHLAKLVGSAGNRPRPGEGSEKHLETAVSSAPVLSSVNRFSKWPLGLDQCESTEYAWLVTPFLHVLQSSQATFSEVAFVIEALDMLTSADGSNTAVYTNSTSIGSTTIDLPITQPDLFINVAATAGGLVLLVSFADDSRLFDCPGDETRRKHLSEKVESLVLRFIDFGQQKQGIAVSKYKLHLESPDSSQIPASGGDPASPSEQTDSSNTKLPDFPYVALWAKSILDLQFDVPRFNYLNYSAILLATELSYNNAAFALLSASASPDTASADGTTPLMTALLTGNEELVRELLRLHPIVDKMTVDGSDICAWNCALVAPLGQNVSQTITSAYETRSAAHNMPLLIQLDTIWGTPTLLKECLAAQLDVNVSDADGNYLLHAVVSKLLVRKQVRGLDLCLRYHSQRADKQFLLATVATLLEKHSADVNACNLLGQTPLHLAVMFGHTEIASYLLRRGANPNIQDVFGYLPLHYACLGFCTSEPTSGAPAFAVLDDLLRGASKFELVAGKHSDLRKHRSPDEKDALAIESILEEGFLDATSPRAITTKVANVQQILTTTGFLDGLLPWHFACGGCSQVAATVCLDDDMRSRFHANGAVRASILVHLKDNYAVDLSAAANKNMTALHFALKTDFGGSNADVVTLLLATEECRAQINDVHECLTIDALPPIPEASRVDVSTANVHASQCYVSSRSLDSRYHIILPNGDHLGNLHREAIHPSDRISSVPTACGLKSKYSLLMESAFSPLHYALQSSDEMALRLLSCADISLNPEGSDLPLLALACAARRSAQVVEKLISQQANVRVHLPLLGAQLDEVASESAECNLAGRQHASALHYAVLYEDVDVVNVLVSKGEHTNVNVRRSGDGFTPLHLACEMGHMELIKLLLDHGANLLQMSTLSASAQGVTPLHLLLRNDTVGNDKLKRVVAAKYLLPEMLLEDLGASLMHRPDPGTAREMEARPQSHTDLDVEGSSAKAERDSNVPTTSNQEHGITCMLLAVEEHNLSLYTRLCQLRENASEDQETSRRLVKDLEKSDGALQVLFRLFAEEPFASPSTTAPPVSLMTEETRISAVQSPLRTASFESVEHRHECYRQKIVRSQWIPPRPPAAMRRVSSMNAEAVPAKENATSETTDGNPAGNSTARRVPA